MAQSLKRLSPDELVEAVKDAYRKAFDGSGRLGRREFLYYQIFFYGVILVGWFLMPVPHVRGTSMNALMGTLSFYSTVGQFAMVGMLLLAIPLPSLYARRLHDLGQSGWWTAVIMIVSTMAPVIAVVVDILLVLAAGAERDRGLPYVSRR